MDCASAVAGWPEAITFCVIAICIAFVMWVFFK